MTMMSRAKMRTELPFVSHTPFSCHGVRGVRALFTGHIPRRMGLVRFDHGLIFPANKFA